MSSPEVQRRAADGARGIRTLFRAAVCYVVLRRTLGDRQGISQCTATTTIAFLPAYNQDSTSGVLRLLPVAPLADRLEGGLLAIDGPGNFCWC